MDISIALPPWLIPFLFVFFGMLARTWLPYYKKIQSLRTIAEAQGKSPSEVQIKWNNFYTYTIIGDILITLVGTMFFFNTWTPPAGTDFAIAIASFIAGWGAQDIINTFAK